VPVTCTPASGSPFPNGQTTVTCKATDAHGNAATSSFTVTVLSAGAQLNALTNAVRSAAELQGPGRKKLRDKLTSDLTQSGQANLAKACHALAQFSTDVQANTTPGGPITTADSSAWVAAANAIRAARGC